MASRQAPRLDVARAAFVTAVAIALVVAASPLVSSAAFATSASPSAAVDTTHWTINSERLNAALLRYLGARHVRATLALYDETTGQTFGVHAASRFRTASIVKVDILAVLLLQHQRSRTAVPRVERTLAAEMIEHSDNAAASSLWGRVGGGLAMDRANAILGLTSTTAGAHGAWGLTLTTSADQVRLLRLVSDSDSVLHVTARRYIASLMSHVETDQRWGVTAAADARTEVRVKDGWLPYSHDDYRWIINSIGIVRVDGHVLDLATLSNLNPTEHAGIATVEHVARMVRTALSPAQAVPPAYVVTAALDAPTVQTGASTLVTGRVSPAAAGRVVHLQELQDATWRTIASAVLTSASRYQVTVPPDASAGSRTLRVEISSEREHRSGTSPTLRLVVVSAVPPTTRPPVLDELPGVS